MICPCCLVHRMTLWPVHAVQCTEWPYDLSMLFSTQNGLMTCPYCPVHRMTLWPVHAVQCTEWPYDLPMLFSALNDLMTCPCCSVHRMTLWPVHALQYAEWPYDLSMLSSAKNGLMTCPCCSVHSRALVRNKTPVTIYEKEMPLLQCLTMVPQTQNYQVFCTFQLSRSWKRINASTNGFVGKARRLLRHVRSLEQRRLF